MKDEFEQMTIEICNFFETRRANYQYHRSPKDYLGHTKIVRYFFLFSYYRDRISKILFTTLNIGRIQDFTLDYNDWQDIFVRFIDQLFFGQNE